MIKCRQRAGGRGGRQRCRGKREGEGETEKEASTSSAVSHPEMSLHLPDPSPLGPDLSEPTRCPKSPMAATAIALGCNLRSRCWDCDSSDLPLPPAGQQKQAASTKNSCKTIALLHINPANAQHPGRASRDCQIQTPTPAQSSCMVAGARGPSATPEPSQLQPHHCLALDSPACSSLPSQWAPSWCHSNFFLYWADIGIWGRKLWPSRCTDAQGVEGGRDAHRSLERLKPPRAWYSLQLVIPQGSG